MANCEHHTQPLWRLEFHTEGAPHWWKGDILWYDRDRLGEPHCVHAPTGLDALHTITQTSYEQLTQALKHGTAVNLVAQPDKKWKITHFREEPVYQGGPPVCIIFYEAYTQDDNKMIITVHHAEEGEYQDGFRLTCNICDGSHTKR